MLMAIDATLCHAYAATIAMLLFFRHAVTTLRRHMFAAVADIFAMLRYIVIVAMPFTKRHTPYSAVTLLIGAVTFTPRADVATLMIRLRCDIFFRHALIDALRCPPYREIITATISRYV